MNTPVRLCAFCMLLCQILFSYVCGPDVRLRVGGWRQWDTLMQLLHPYVDPGAYNLSSIR